MTEHELQLYYAMRTYWALYKASGIIGYAKSAINAKNALKKLRATTKTFNMVA